jgi:uncharacterized RDD family membrane protein YckC
MLDTAQRIATPEGVELTLRLAGPVPRALAWLIDFIWRFALLIALTMMLVPLGRIGQGVFLIVWFALEWLVPAACEVWFGGATPGKKALGLAVLRDDGAPVGWTPALVRNLLRFVDFLPLFYLGGLIAMLLNREFKRLGDLAAGTVVVHGSGKRRERRNLEAEPIALARRLERDERRAILDFAERAPELSPQRAEELARLVVPLLVTSPIEADASAQLLSIASHLSGTRPEAGARASS